ncbi:hypothetical protein TGAM01_v202201 [Trichoderma gamsii]|uniref:Uncharacterized protein n=1 Tax=Trichoderma gamsii TaxID=398673 RepID=A0A2P4ZXW4_9HYPO|nr:hypothetical protein TGAM01_v202201 [Trichoderma gamsii]PON29093.1 hypothetical protein TGAM01_v202201 [Trichoderma gamsii]
MEGQIQQEPSDRHEALAAGCNDFLTKLVRLLSARQTSFMAFVPPEWCASLVILFSATKTQFAFLQPQLTQATTTAKENHLRPLPLLNRNTTLGFSYIAYGFS